MEPDMETQSPWHASRMPVTMTMQRVPTPQIRILKATVSQLERKFREIYGQSPTDLEGWRRATVLEWQALAHFHSDLAAACLLLLLMTKPFHSSAGLSTEIWEGLDAFFRLHDHSQSPVDEPVIAMIDTAACVTALLYFYEPIYRAGYVQNLKTLGAYRLALNIPVENIAEELTWALIAGYTRSGESLTVDADSAVKSLLQLKSIQRCGKCIDQIVTELVFQLYVASLPERASMDELFFLPAGTIYDSVLDMKGKGEDEGACINESMRAVAPTPTLNGE